MINYQEQVSRGARLLDVERPDWRNEIDVNALDMHKHGSCVLGQLYGSYLIGDRILCEPNLSAIDHGFSLSGDPHPNPSKNWEELANAWRAEIEQQ
jgi:hypothetical protein